MVDMIHIGLSGPRQGSPQPPKYPESGSGTIRPVSKQSNSLFWIRTEPAPPKSKMAANSCQWSCSLGAGAQRVCDFRINEPIEQEQ